MLSSAEGPFIAASDYIKNTPDSVARFIPGTFVPLGTDGFGMSDTREALRRHFEVDAENVVLGALHGLRLDGKMSRPRSRRRHQKLNIDPDKLEPMKV